MVALRPPFTLRQLLASLYLVGTLALTLGIIVSLQQRLNAYFYDDLLKNGRAIVQRAAEASRLPIIQGTVQHIRPNLETMTAYPDVTGLVIVTSQGKAVSALGSDPVTPGLETLIGAAPGHSLERPDSITVIAPIVERGLTAPGRDSDLFGDMTRQSTPSAAPRSTTAPNTLGYVALTLTKANMRAGLRAIDRHVLAVMGAGALLVTLLALVALDRLTRPIKRLARTMADPETARQLRPVEVRGVREARVIATAYNELIARVAASRDDLARQVEAAVREVKRQNAELVVAREKAEAANQAKSRFLSSVSHEFRKPLHGVIAGADLLLKTRSLDRRQREYTATIHHSASLLLNLVNNILDWSRMEATDDLALSEKDFSPAELLEQTREIVAPEAQSKDVRLELSVDRAVPARVRGDPTRLGQVLLNLVGNAVKFTERGAVAVAARLAPTGSAAAPDTAIRLRFDVTDTGIGIEPRALATIFEGFAQADATIGRDYGGTGLGLSITRRLVKRMNGEIGVESTPDAGSHFWIEIPFPPAEDAPAVTRPAAVASAARHTRSLLVLAADDSWINQRIMEAILTNGGHRPHLVADGEAALAALRGSTRFDLAILDLQMPKLWGHEVVKRYRESPEKPAIPVILLTADVTAAGQAAARTEGVSAALQKPIIEDELLDVIHRLIAGWPARGARALRSSPATRADGEESRTLRPALLDRLRQLPPTVVPEVIDNFVRNAPRRVRRIDEAAEAGDASALREALHLLGGASGTLGGERVAAACEAIRQASARGDAAAVRAGVAELPASVDRLIERLKAYPPP